MEILTQSAAYLSIVVPVYNCEKYISRCLKSIVNQTYDNLEIIIINDGSTDNSAEVCRKYAMNDKRIVYVEQPNKGVSYTRKRGIELATGKYIGFVDADDYIELTMYEQLLPYMDKAELVTSGYYQCERKIADKIERGLYQTPNEIHYFLENAILFHDTNEPGISSNLWSKLFCAQKLKSIMGTVPEDIFYGEDLAILLKYIFECVSYYVSPVCAYHYEPNHYSISNSLNKKYLHNMNSLYLYIEEAIRQTAYGEFLLPKWNQATWNTVQMAPRFMGFDLKYRWKQIRYLSPYMNLLKGKQVILYGAGVVGRDYYRLYQKSGDFDIILWVDSEWEKLKTEGWDVQHPDVIFNTKFDAVLIAVKSAQKAKEIKEYLCLKGIGESKILWKEPISLMD